MSPTTYAEWSIYKRRRKSTFKGDKMSSVLTDTGVVGGEPGLLAKERTIAGPGFNRWLVPPAALAIHLCIGMAYGFSVFWLPLSKSLTGAAACTRGTGFW